MKFNFDSNMTQVLKQTFLNRQIWIIFILALTVFLSALSVIYTKNWHRSLFIQVEQLQQQRDKLHTEWTQLLLEESTWASQGRIQKMATSQLNMKIPAASEMRIIKAAPASAMPVSTGS